MKAGDPFNSYKQFSRALIIPLSLVQSGLVSMGAIVTYARLSFYKAPDSTSCYVDRKTLAAELKVSVDTVDRYLKELTTNKLIRPIRRGPQKNAYEFLYHEVLVPSLKESADLPTQVKVEESAEMQTQGPKESAKIPSQGETPTAESGQICGNESANLRSRVGISAHRIKEEKEYEKDFEKESSSSSYQNCGRFNKDDDDGAVPPLQKTHPAQDATLWTQETRRIVRELLLTSLGECSTIGDIDCGAVSAILRHMASVEDVKLWLVTSRTLLARATSWGLYIEDAKRWPSRRADARRQFEELQEAERHEEARCREAIARLGEQESESELIDVATVSERPATTEPCARCDSSGVVGIYPQESEWCDCEYGVQKRARDPELVNKLNRSVKLFQMAS